MAFAIPRQLTDIMNAGSIENAHEEVRSAEARRRIESALEKAAASGEETDRAQMRQTSSHEWDLGENGAQHEVSARSK